MRNLLGIMMLLCTMAIHADEPMSINIDADKPNFVITLAANPTTGFQWTVVEFDKDLLSLSSSVYQRPDTKLIGAGGHMLFTFTLNKGKAYPQSTNLVFKYARPWEKDDTGATQTVTVNFVKSE